MPADSDALPQALTINAWTGELADSRGAFAPNTKSWATKPAPGSKKTLAFHLPDLRDWKDPSVGWGLLVEHRPDRSAADAAALKDMPEAIRQLVAFRNGVVLGWDKANGTDSLIRYLPDGTTRRVVIGDIQRGTAPGALPHYILILGGPDKIPWLVQYTLNLVAAVGRLDLDEAGLNNYVSAAIANWAETPLDVSRCVLWSVDQGGTDITTLMKKTVAAPLFDELKGDAHIGAHARFLTDKDATHARLIEAVSTDKPALIVTTSHGKTGPLNDPDVMRRDLGLMVDRANAALPLADLLMSGSRTARSGTPTPAVPPAAIPARCSPACSRRVPWRRRWRTSASSGRNPRRCRGRSWVPRSRCAPSSVMSSRHSTGR